MGGSATNRNLLDFNEITIDDKGRPAFGYSDGCVGDCVGNPTLNSFTAHMRLARQSGGKTLFAAFDPVEPALPKAPCLSGTRDSNASHLSWRAPDNGGADIRYYKIYRGTAPGGETFLADTGSDIMPNARTTYDDTTADPAVAHYYYTVKAVNAQGIGVDSNEIDLEVAPLPPEENLCLRPGLTKLTDAEGDNIGGPGSDLKSFQISQPFSPTDAEVGLHHQHRSRDGGAARQFLLVCFHADRQRPDDQIQSRPDGLQRTDADVPVLYAGCQYWRDG